MKIQKYLFVLIMLFSCVSTSSSEIYMVMQKSRKVWQVVRFGNLANQAVLWSSEDAEKSIDSSITFMVPKSSDKELSELCLLESKNGAEEVLYKLV
jgi:hypothetical protein